jgi:hypothetical protein
MSIRHVAVGALAVLALIPLGSCTSATPVKVTAGDQCFRCRRTIPDERVASEIISANFVSKFRAPGCMAKYIVDHPADGGTVFVTDYTTGKMIAPEAAYFVPLTVNVNTGERDYRAYRLKTVADLAAADLNTTPVDWTTVLERARS